HRVGIVDHGEIIAIGTQPELTQMVGQHDTLILKVPGVTPSVLEALGSVPGVDKCLHQDGDDGEIRLLAAAGRSVLPDAIRIINEAHLSLNSVEVHEPTLEAVFLHLTGRALRD
ncbi:MAG: export ABC transporter ATP-binding protein, partial [Chloroflexi bacterium]|nr:export ABC transporter ATP-binding protein [Chloroflexota bacterium]